jgi:ketosteroid isomerase-like protein
VADEHPMTDEEQAMCDAMNTSSWNDPTVDYRAQDLDRLVDRYAPDAISIPANHHCLFGHADIRAWYAKRTGGDYEMNVVARCDRVDIVGDIAVAVGVFRVTRAPKEGVAGLDHAGRYLNVMRRIDGEWKMWRDADTPSPDADVLYDQLPRGW